MSWVDALCTAVSRFDSGFSAGIRPASAVDIASFERLVGHPIPKDHLEFLKVMGESDGGLGSDFGSDTALSRIRSLCGRGSFDPHEWLPFALFEEEWIGLLVRGAPEHPSVVRLTEGRPGALVASSLATLVFHQAFFWELAALGKGADFMVSTGRKASSSVRWREPWAMRLREIGYTEERFALPDARHFRSGGKLIILSGRQADRLHVYGGAADPASFATVLMDLDALARANGATVQVRKRRTLPRVDRDEFRGKKSSRRKPLRGMGPGGHGKSQRRAGWGVRSSKGLASPRVSRAGSGVAVTAARNEPGYGAPAPG